ncbi:MAG: nascent polypeptide-associated complex protein [Candidatus Woesearchaeota archaeon]|nr:nascent polypeptide-associated complex protein [Candidatus Woesearchaeota archaeon]
MFPKINQRQLQNAMHQMGISQTEIEAEEVIIKCRDRNIVISEPSVLKVKMSGDENFQISGKIREEKISSEPEITEEDIKTVMEKANASREDAEGAIKKSGGDLAEAILSLSKS